MLEEIIVTAQNANKNINDVGVAVTVYSGDQFKALGFESFTDLIAYGSSQESYPKPRTYGVVTRRNF